MTNNEAFEELQGLAMQSCWYPDRAPNLKNGPFCTVCVSCQAGGMIIGMHQFLARANREVVTRERAKDVNAKQA